MKKISSLILILIICIAFATFVACEEVTYTVTFINGETVVETITVAEGKCVETLPTITVADNMQFDGWFVGEDEFTTSTVVTSDITVTAKISEKSGQEPPTDQCTVTLKLNADTVYDTITVKAGTELDLYDYSTMDYEIHQWTDEDGQTYDYTDICTITKNVTLTAVNPLKSQFTLQLSNDGTYYIVLGLFDTSATTATIRATYFDIPIKEIAPRAFKAYNKNLKQLIVPNTIEKIGEEAFAGLYGLEELTVPFVGEQKYDEVSGNGLKAEFAYWFADDVNLDYRPEYVHGYSLYYDGSGEEIDENIAFAERFVPKSLTTVTINGGAIANYAFHTITTIETINLGDEVTALGNHAFGVNPQATDMPSTDYMLKNIECSENSKIASIGENCFTNQINLEKVCIAPKVKVLHESLFRGFSKLTEITIFENSELEIINDNVFYGAPIASIYLPDTLTTIGVHAFSSCMELTEVNIPQFAVNLEGGIFRGCENLTKVTFAPQSQITEIPEYMFAGCLKLTTVKLPAAVVKFNMQAFNNCNSLSKLNDEEIGFELQNVTYIGDSALAATAFKYIDISENITYIGGGAFAGCSKLEGIYFNDTSEDCPLTEILSNTFDGCASLKSIELPDSITKIGIRAFSYTGLKTVVLPANLEVIDDRAFYLFNSEESALTTITNPGDLEYLKSIGDSAFENNSKLTFTSLPESLKTVGAMAFRNTGISGTITIDPAKLTEIGAYAFASCPNAIIEVIGTNSDIPSKWQGGWAGLADNATKVTFTDEDEHYVMLDGGFEYYEEDGIYYVTKYVGNETEVVLQDTFKDLPVVYNQSVFASNKKITSVTLAPSMTTIPRGFFTDCSSLTTVTVPETTKITSIGDYAFRHCNLYSFTIPDASELTYIGDYAFYGNSKATHITLTNNSKIKHIGESAFETWYAASGTELIKLDLDLSETEYIGDNAFAKNVNVIAEYTLTSSLEYLGEAAFSGGKKLTLTLSDGFSATRFENNVFDQVGTLIWENASFEGVEYIGDSAFASIGGSLAKGKINIPNTVTYIGKSAFLHTNLAGVIIDCNSELEIGDNAFGYSATNFYVVIKGTPKKIGYAICSTTNKAHIYFTETITVSTTYPRVFTLGESDCIINNMFYIYNEDYEHATNVPYFGAGQWTADENGEPIHPTDGHKESSNK